MKENDTKWCRAIIARPLRQTDHRGWRIALAEKPRTGSLDVATEKKVIPWVGDDFQEEAFDTLVANGWNVVAKANINGDMVFLVDNWEPYLHLKDIVTLAEIERRKKMSVK